MIAMAASASAAVTIQSSFNNGVDFLVPADDLVEVGGNFTYTVSATTLGGFDATAGDKFVLGWTSRGYTDGVRNTQGSAVISITYGGVELTQAEQLSANRGTTGAWFADGLTSNGDLVINFGEFSDVGEIGLSLFAINGLEAGGPASSGTGGTAPTVTLGSGGGFILHSAARNNQNLTVNEGFTEDYRYSAGSSRMLSQHLITTDAGSFTPNGNNTAGASHTTVAFAAIPEPSTALLGGLGLLALLRRRRG